MVLPVGRFAGKIQWSGSWQRSQVTYQGKRRYKSHCLHVLSFSDDFLSICELAWFDRLDKK